MKLNIFLLSLLLLFLCCISFAHSGKKHKHVSLRQWNFADKNKQIKASLLLLKDGIVHLEKANGKVEKYSLSSLSKNDQNFVSKRYEEIAKLNNSVILGKAQSIKSITDPMFLESAFAPFKPNVATRWDENSFYVESLGIADHTMMVGITSWQQQVPIPQCYIGNNAWSIPLNPELADNPLSLQESLMRGAVAIAANGIPIFNPLNNRGDDAFLVGELDDFGGHSGRADDYHYHIAPLHLEDKTEEILPIAFALDGYAIYGSKEPDGSDMQPLDQYNGHIGADNVYHYHGTETYPYIMGSMVGKVTTDNGGTESQILPQAGTTPVRPFLQPLQGAVITGFEQTGETSYSLVYTLNNENYTLNYDWTAAGVYNFEFVNPDGSSTDESHNGFTPCEIDNNVTEVADRESSNYIPTEYNLKQNYPNPFNPSTTISFSIPAEGFVTLKIFNTLGELVETLANQNLSAGQYNYLWNASNVSGGVYFYSLTVDGKTIMIKKMMLIK